jgi:hypothetical protein
MLSRNHPGHRERMFAHARRIRGEGADLADLISAPECAEPSPIATRVRQMVRVHFSQALRFMSIKPILEEDWL